MFPLARVVISVHYVSLLLSIVSKSMFLLHAKSRVLYWTHGTKRMKVSVKKPSTPLEFLVALSFSLW